MKQTACEDCGKLFTKANMIQHKKLHADKPLSCALCNKAYTRRIDLSNHEKMHEEARPFKGIQIF